MSSRELSRKAISEYPWYVPVVDPKYRKLNIGSGSKYIDGWVNMDISSYCEPDIIHDIFEIPWPFEEKSFDYILASHVLEHIPPILKSVNGKQRDGLMLIMEEMHRILSINGILEIRVPFYRTSGASRGLTHYRQLAASDFDCFFHEITFHPEKGLTSARFSCERISYSRHFVIPFFPPIFLTESISKLIHRPVNFGWKHEMILILRKFDENQ